MSGGCCIGLAARLSVCLSVCLSVMLFVIIATLRENDYVMKRQVAAPCSRAQGEVCCVCCFEIIAACVTTFNDRRCRLLYTSCCV